MAETKFRERYNNYHDELQNKLSEYISSKCVFLTLPSKIKMRKNGIMTIKIQIRSPEPLMIVESNVLKELDEKYDFQTASISSLGIELKTMAFDFQEIMDTTQTPIEANPVEWIYQLRANEIGIHEIYLSLHKYYAVDPGREMSFLFDVSDPIVVTVKKRISERIFIKGLLQNWFLVIPIIVGVPFIPKLKEYIERKKKKKQKAH